MPSNRFAKLNTGQLMPFINLGGTAQARGRRGRAANAQALRPSVTDFL